MLTTPDVAHCGSDNTLFIQACAVQSRIDVHTMQSAPPLLLPSAKKIQIGLTLLHFSILNVHSSIQSSDGASLSTTAVWKPQVPLVLEVRMNVGLQI